MVRAYHPARAAQAARDAVTLCRALTNAAAFEPGTTAEDIRQRASCAIFGYRDARARPGQTAAPGADNVA